MREFFLSSGVFLLFTNHNTKVGMYHSNTIYLMVNLCFTYSHFAWQVHQSNKVATGKEPINVKEWQAKVAKNLLKERK
jgi:hypothetical protein